MRESDGEGGKIFPHTDGPDRTALIIFPFRNKCVERDHAQIFGPYRAVLIKTHFLRLRLERPQFLGVLSIALFEETLRVISLGNNTPTQRRFVFIFSDVHFRFQISSIVSLLITATCSRLKMNPALKVLDDALKNRPIPSSFDAVKGAPEAERSSVVNENIPNITATDRATILTAWKNAVQDAAPAKELPPPGLYGALWASQARIGAAERGRIIQIGLGVLLLFVGIIVNICVTLYPANSTAHSIAPYYNLFKDTLQLLEKFALHRIISAYQAWRARDNRVAPIDNPSSSTTNAQTTQCMYPWLGSTSDFFADYLCDNCREGFLTRRQLDDHLGSECPELVYEYFNSEKQLFDGFWRDNSEVLRPRRMIKKSDDCWLLPMWKT
ncbi:hypothetical protein PROFUN_16457 [Planoprotostelium fungivorum]|uniref:Uncharacterized protein n=1 Tax=Planoprotostelium fungivorum TaxID=1890364 RepID=A0A2P6MQN1_9EUKA|nr:hypothetical protein PROFUN_16457 [Planoprotostelium fungivorum]